MLNFNYIINFINFINQKKELNKCNNKYFNKKFS